MGPCDRRSWGIREEIPRGFRECRSLEGSFRGKYCAFIGHTPASYLELFTEIIGVCVQEDCLWVADPKALNHILQKSGYSYAKPNNINEVIVLLADRGVASVGGELSITVRHLLLVH